VTEEILASRASLRDSNLSLLSSKLPIVGIKITITNSEINPVRAIRNKELFENVATNKEIPILHMFWTKEKKK
jgi:hypothetical protein